MKMNPFYRITKTQGYLFQAYTECAEMILSLQFKST